MGHSYESSRKCGYITFLHQVWKLYRYNYFTTTLQLLYILLYIYRWVYCSEADTSADMEPKATGARSATIAPTGAGAVSPKAREEHF